MRTLSWIQVNKGPLYNVQATVAIVGRAAPWLSQPREASEIFSCLPSFISRFAVAGSAEIDRRRGHCHGTQQGAVPEGAQRSGIRRAVWHGGKVPRCGDGLTLA